MCSCDECTGGTVEPEPIEQLAAEALGYFQTKTRDSGEDFVSLTDDRPEWLFNLVYAAHDGMLPDDYRYKAVRNAISAIADGSDPDDPHEWADGAVDVHTAGLTAWLASSLSRVGYCDDAAAEYGTDPAEENPTIRRLQLGQYAELAEVYAVVVDQLREQLDARDDDDDDQEQAPE